MWFNFRRLQMNQSGSAPTKLYRIPLTAKDAMRLVSGWIQVVMHRSDKCFFGVYRYNLNYKDGWLRPSCFKVTCVLTEVLSSVILPEGIVRGAVGYHRPPQLIWISGASRNRTYCPTPSRFYIAAGKWPMICLADCPNLLLYTEDFATLMCISHFTVLCGSLHIEAESLAPTEQWQTEKTFTTNYKMVLSL